MKRGDIYWADLGPPAGRRPVVVLTRTRAIAVRTNVTIAPVTTTLRGTAFEVPLGRREGLPRPCVASCDDIATVPKRVLEAWIGALGARKLVALDRALAFALGITS